MPSIVREEPTPDIPNNIHPLLDPEPVFSDDEETHTNNDDEDDIPLGQFQCLIGLNLLFCWQRFLFFIYFFFS